MASAKQLNDLDKRISAAKGRKRLLRRVQTSSNSPN